MQFQLYVDWNTGTGTGNLLIDGLPFTTANVGVNPVPSIFVYSLALTAGHIAQAFLVTNAIKIEMRQYPSGGGTDVNIAYDTAAGIFATGTYFV